MGAVKATLKRLAIYYLLLAINIIPNADILPDVFPTRNVSTVYLLVLSACLIRYYSYRVLRTGYLSFMMRALSWMAFLLILLRGVKYSVFAGDDVLARHSWYAYYIPMLLIPLFFFYVSLMISPRGDGRISAGWLPVAALTLALILLVLTNDWHQLVFRFKPDFEDWNDDYARGLWFYAVTVWQYVLYIAAVVVLAVKCRVGGAKKYAWLTAIPFSGGVLMSALLMTERMPRINDSFIVEFPEALILMVVGVLECCIQLGLIPTNKGYGKLFSTLSLSTQITDETGKPVYTSRSAVPLTPERFSAPDGTRIGEHTVLHKMELPGGWGFWQDDMTELDRLNEELAEVNEGLVEEADLNRLKNELRVKQAKIEQRTAVYDRIAGRTKRHSEEISRLASSARLSRDPERKKKCGRQITLLASYVKRYANLMLLSYESSTVEAGELALSFSEVLRYLNLSGVPGELVDASDGVLPAGSALVVFEAFGKLLLDNLNELSGAFINLSTQNGLSCKLTLEKLRTQLREEQRLALSAAGIHTETVTEDDVTYISFTLPEGRQSA